MNYPAASGGEYNPERFNEIDIKYSLIICTYNQCGSLSKVLECLSAQKVDNSARLEILVIDNNSSDKTRETCLNWYDRIPFSFRYIFEGRQGLSVARNRGVSESVGDILIFTDDDAKLPHNWLQTYIDTYEEYDTDCVYGKILIEWNYEKPFWYSDRFQAVFVGLDYGTQLLNISDKHHEFFGKNFSLRKEILIKFGGFDENLGRTGDKLFIGEETKLYHNLIKNGYTVIYNPNLYVHHMLKDYEYTLAHFKKYYRDATFSQYYMLRGSATKKILGRPIYVLKEIGIFFTKMPFVVLYRLIRFDKREFLYIRLEISRHVLLLFLWLKNKA